MRNERKSEQCSERKKNLSQQFQNNLVHMADKMNATMNQSIEILKESQGKRLKAIEEREHKYMEKVK